MFLLITINGRMSQILLLSDSVYARIKIEKSH